MHVVNGALSLKDQGNKDNEVYIAKMAKPMFSSIIYMNILQYII